VTAPLPYRVVRHPAPADLDLSGTELNWRRSAAWSAPDELGRYPDRGPLTAALADRLGIAADQVLVTAGSDDALERLFRMALAPGREALLTRPTFEMLPRFVRSTGADLVEVAWPGSEFPLEQLRAAVTPRTALIAIVSPNNPTGAVVTPREVAAIGVAAPEALIVVDLAYVEFADRDPTSELLTLPRTLITRTFSKAWGMAGLRVGYVAGPAPLVSRLEASSLPYPVAAPALRTASDALSEDPTELRELIAGVRETRAALTTTLSELGAPALPSQGNFLTVDGPRAPWVRDGLAGLGIATRALTDDREIRVRLTCLPDPRVRTRVARALRTVLRPRALLLDMDGVIADVSRSYREAIIGTAAEFGVQISGPEIQALKRRGRANDDWALTAELLADAGRPVPLAEVTAVFEGLYHGNEGRPGLQVREQLIPSPELLERLAARVPLAIVTGRPRGDTDRFLTTFDLADLFSAVVTRDDGPCKPDPFPVLEALRRLDVTDAWMVGDTPDDVRAARGAAVVPIGIVAPGDDASATTSALLTAGAGRVLASLDELLELLP
jgi:histidinol-phosphate aminotransferase